MKIETVGFVGLGLIGGSIAKAIKAFHPEIQIMAYMRTTDTLIEAANEGTVDIACTGVDGQFAACDCIFLCAPVSTNVMYLERLKPVIKADCILTDVGSTKTDIHERVTALDLEEHFIGGHPMAGSEKTGYANAKPHLIENAYYIITPSARVPKEAVDMFVPFIASLKALPLVLDYRRHDFITASVSHLPHLIASSLVNLVQELDSTDALMKRIAAGGFKDITRIASSSPVMWQHICLKNKENLLKILDEYIRFLGSAREMIDQEDEQGIYHMFDTSRNYRNSIPASSAGPIKKAYEVYCDIIDEAGGIAAIATILASNGLNLKNIGIIHNREFEEGVLRIEFYDEASMKKAAEILQKFRYIVYER